MTPYILSPLARDDLNGIWDYTSQRWDETQAEASLRMIQAAIEAVAANPKLGRSYVEVRTGYRRHRVGSHLIFNRQAADAIDMVRVLHEKMDIASYLVEPSSGLLPLV